MKRFLPWLIPITVLLAAVPVLLIIESAAMAKIIGVIMVVVTSVALRVWLYNAGKLRKHSDRVLFTVNERYTLEAAWPYYRVMPKSERGVIEERAGLLLAGLSFDNYDHSEPSEESCLLFAAVLATLVPEGAFHHPIYKVVVFRKGETEMITQEKATAGSKEVNHVLFIDEAELKSALATVDGTDLSSALSGATCAKLQEFYAF